MFSSQKRDPTQNLLNFIYFYEINSNIFELPKKCHNNTKRSRKGFELKNQDSILNSVKIPLPGADGFTAGFRI